jgi:hypothetical protein
MKWDLAHHPCGADESTPATVEVPDSWAVVEQLGGEIMCCFTRGRHGNN